MKYLLVLAMCTLATAKVTFQSSFSKKSIHNMTDALLFNGCVFAVSAILFCSRLVGCPREVWIYGAIFGTLTVIFQITYSFALSMQSVSLTVMIVNLSLVMPIILSITVYGEQITPFQIVGTLVTLSAFAIGVDSMKSRKSRLGFFFSICAFLANGGLAITQKVFGKSELSQSSQAFVSSSYVCAAVLAISLFFLISRRQKLSFKVKPNMFLISAAVGITLAVFQAVNTYAVSTVDAAFLFPTYAGGSIILSSVCGIIIFRDKLKKRQIISLALGVIAVVLMNF